MENGKSMTRVSFEQNYSKSNWFTVNTLQSHMVLTQTVTLKLNPLVTWYIEIEMFQTENFLTINFWKIHWFHLQERARHQAEIDELHFKVQNNKENLLQLQKQQRANEKASVKHDFLNHNHLFISTSDITSSTCYSRS